MGSFFTQKRRQENTSYPPAKIASHPPSYLECYNFLIIHAKYSGFNRVYYVLANIYILGERLSKLTREAVQYSTVRDKGVLLFRRVKSTTDA